MGSEKSAFLLFGAERFHDSFAFLFSRLYRSVLGEEEVKPVTPLPNDYCGSCYGSESQAGQCCNTCEQVQEAYRKRGWAFSNADNIEQVGRNLDLSCLLFLHVFINPCVCVLVFFICSAIEKVGQKKCKNKLAKDVRFMVICL